MKGNEMTPDDVLAYLAAKPKRERPTELRSDSRMLAAWLRLRNDRDFRSDIIDRHGLQKCVKLDDHDTGHQHAIGNAWGHCVHVLVIAGKAVQ